MSQLRISMMLLDPIKISYYCKHDDWHFILFCTQIKAEMNNVLYGFSNDF